MVCSTWSGVELSEWYPQLTARVNAHQRASVGQKLDLAFDLKKCHFFDGVTEKTIV